MSKITPAKDLTILICGWSSECSSKSGGFLCIRQYKGLDSYEMGVVKVIFRLSLHVCEENINGILYV